jgi:hypothetical protein
MGPRISSGHPAAPKRDGGFRRHPGHNNTEGAVMIRQLSIEALDEVLLVPRVIVAVPVSHFAKKLALGLVKDCDDLDYFEGLVLSLTSLNGDIPFTLTTHRGNAKGETTISLPITFGTANAIAAVFGRIADELGIDSKLVVWRQDSDDPPRKFA